MTTRVYVHVGPFKTGTTFIQQVLDENRERLAAHGVLVPVRRTQLHAQAAGDAMGLPANELKPRVTWEELAAEVRAWSGPTAVVSAEVLSRAGTRQVARMVDALQPAEVHVVFMARDLSRVVPAMWQTGMRSGRSEPWRSYLASVRGDAGGSPSGQRFWQTHDPRQVLDRWGTRIPPERIHVVTVPPSGADRSVLWRRFCAVVGLDADLCSLDVRRMNESLGTAEAELLRRVNAEVSGELNRAAYNRWVKRFIAREVLERRPGQRRFALPESELGWLRPRAEEIVGFLRSSAYDVVGDLDEVLPVPASAGLAEPDQATPEEVLDAAVEVIAGLLRKADRRARGASARPSGRRLRKALPAVRRRAKGLRRRGAAGGGRSPGTSSEVPAESGARTALQ